MWVLPGCLMLVIALPLVLMAMVVWVLPQPSSGFSVSAHPVGYPVQTDFDAGVVGASASLSWKHGATVYAPDWSGLVIAVKVHRGQSVTTGSPIAVVDGITRLAVASATPFYRTLTTGESGPDVVMLRTALSELGLGSYGTASSFDAGLQRGVGRLCTLIGCDPVSTTFDPSWFVYLPAPKVVVGAVHLDPVQPAPPAGQEILTAASTLSALSVGAINAGDSDNDGIGSASFPASGDGYEFVPDSMGGVRIPLTSGFTPAITMAKTVQVLGSGISADDTSLTGTIRLIHSRRVSSLPATALVTGSGGDMCIYPYGSNPASLTPVKVQVVGGEPGITTVAPLTGPKMSQVVANPADLSGLVPCP